MEQLRAAGVTVNTVQEGAEILVRMATGGSGRPDRDLRRQRGSPFPGDVEQAVLVLRALAVPGTALIHVRQVHAVSQLCLSQSMIAARTIPPR